MAKSEENKQNKSYLSKLYRETTPGAPISSEDLSALGISSNLASHYVRTGWLNRLSRGVFHRPDGPLELHPSLRFLERHVRGLHIGGKTALEWHGIQHNLTHRPSLRLYGWDTGPLPAWFAEHFPQVTYHRLRLFEEDPVNPSRLSRIADPKNSPLTSQPERAALELLSEVGVRIPFQDASDILEGAPHLRASVLEELLLICRQVKTVRLCLKLGAELQLPWAAKLNPKRFPTGSSKRWVGQSKEGLLIL